MRERPTSLRFGFNWLNQIGMGAARTGDHHRATIAWNRSLAMYPYNVCLHRDRFDKVVKDVEDFLTLCAEPFKNPGSNHTAVLPRPFQGMLVFEHVFVEFEGATFQATILIRGCMLAQDFLAKTA